jgi:hypothetical protein
MAKLKTGPTEGLHKEQPKEAKEKARRLATDFYLTFNTVAGAEVLKAIKAQIATTPSPTMVNPNECAWYYMGMLEIKLWIEKQIATGEKVNQHGG